MESVTVSFSESPTPLTLLCYMSELFHCKMKRSTDVPFFTNTELILHVCLCDFQLDQLVIDSAMEKREMEHKHATIQQRVSFYFLF